MMVDLQLWLLADVFTCLILAFGLYKKSRTAGVAVVVYWITSKLYAWIGFGLPGLHALLIPAVFMYVYFEGMRATFAYHRLAKEAQPQE